QLVSGAGAATTPLTVRAGNAQTAEVFRVEDFGAAPRLVVSSGGTVGVGTVPTGGNMFEVNGLTKVTGTMSATTVQTADGSVAAAGLGFTSQANTGLYRPAANQLGLLAGGTEGMRLVNNAGAVQNTSAVAGSMLAPAWSFLNDADTGVFNPSANTLAFTAGGLESLRVVNNAGAMQNTAAVGGSAVAPAWSFLSDANTGIFNAGADMLSLAVGGSEALRVINGAGSLQIAAAMAGSMVVPPYTFLSDGDTGMFSASANGLGFTAGGSEAMRVVNNAGVVQNTSAVAGTATAPAWSFLSDANTGIFNAGADMLSLAVGGGELLRVTATQIAAGTLGSAATPAWTLLSDGNTGAFSPGADTLAWSTGGVERARIGSTGNVGIGTIAPQARLDVSQDVLVRGTFVNFGTLSGSTGYGIRDNAGKVEVKNSGGLWEPISKLRLTHDGNPVYTNTTGTFAVVSRFAVDFSDYPTLTQVKFVGETRDTNSDPHEAQIKVNGTAVASSLLSGANNVFQVKTSAFNGFTNPNAPALVEVELRKQSGVAGQAELGSFVIDFR
ncbi:MAG: hypothetical protein HY719_05170, partial [Planctomycetes bacterium]|nr:hypothetical protein [Planctomycetota bacterium]